MQLSKFFTLDEMTLSQIAERHGIDNQPDAVQLANLRRTCTDLLDPIRRAVGRPVSVSSGLRVEEVNVLAGGAKASAHEKGLAADIHVSGMTCKDLAFAIMKLGVVYDQLIYEGSWIHVALAPIGVKPRMQELTAHFSRFGTKYTHGIN